MLGILELNPDERVWSHLKKHELASYAPHDLAELSRGVRLWVICGCGSGPKRSAL